MIDGRESPAIVISDILVHPNFPTKLVSEIKATEAGFVIIKTPPPRSKITFSKNSIPILEAYQLIPHGLFYISEYVPSLNRTSSYGTITEHTFLTSTTTANAVNDI